MRGRGWWLVWVQHAPEMQPLLFQAVGLLASLLPGLRELRAPFTSGVLWLAVVYFAAPGFVDQVGAIGSSLSADLSALNLNELVAPAAIVAFAYLLGLVAQGTVTPLVKAGGSLVMRLVDLVEARRGYATEDRRAVYRRPKWFFSLPQRFELHAWPLNLAGRSLMIDAINSRLSGVGMPSRAAMCFPYDSVIRGLKYMAPQLTSSAPAQFQEYDRLRAEVELRVAVVPALLALSFVVPLEPRPVAVSGAIFICIVLSLQVGKGVRESSNLLANAAYLGYLKSPSLEGLAAELESLKNNKPYSDGGWIAAMVTALDKLGLYDEASAVAAEAAINMDKLEDLRDALHALPSTSDYREIIRRAVEGYEEPPSAEELVRRMLGRQGSETAAE